MKATGFKKCVKKTVLEMYEFMEAEMRKKRSQYSKDFSISEDEKNNKDSGKDKKKLTPAAQNKKKKMLLRISSNLLI